MVKWERIDQNKVEMQIEVEESVVAPALDRAFKKVVKKVSLPGFRKGKVPRAILEKKLGIGILYEEVLDELVAEAYKGAVEEAGIEPIDQPQVDLVQMEKGKPFIFKAMVEVKPEVVLGAYRGVQVEGQNRKISDEEIGEGLAQLQKEHVKLHVVADGSLEQGDLAVVDFTGFLDGQPFPEGSAENYSLEIGSGSFIPGFEEQLTGMRPGEEREIEVVFPEDYHAHELAGKPAVFKVMFKELKRREYPELNDDFAREVSDLDTLAELREDMANRLKKREEERAYAEIADKVVAAVSAAAEVQIPASLVERKIDSMLNDMEQYLLMQGLSMKKFLELANRSLDSLRAEKREEAVKRVKATLVLDAVAEKEGIQSLDKEVDQRIDAIAANYKQDIAKMREYLTAQGRIEAIREEVKREKVIDFLVAEAKTTEVAAVSTEDANKED